MVASQSLREGDYRLALGSVEKDLRHERNEIENEENNDPIHWVSEQIEIDDAVHVSGRLICLEHLPEFADADQDAVTQSAANSDGYDVRHVKTDHRRDAFRS